MRFALLTLALAGCSLFEDSQEAPIEEPAVAPVVQAPVAPSGPNGCTERESTRGLFRIGPSESGVTIALDPAPDWQVDCTRSEDPDGHAQLLSASSASQHSSAYILSLPNPATDDAEAALATAVTEMRQVWEMSGSVLVDRPYPSRPLAVLQATNSEQTEVTWQVVSVSQSPQGNWVRIHQTWSCDDCGLDAMGTKYMIDEMVSSTYDWGYPE